MVWTFLSYEVDGASSRGKRPWDVRELWWAWVLVHSGQQLLVASPGNPLSLFSSQLWGFLWFCFFGSIQVYFSNKGSWTIWALCLIQRVRFHKVFLGQLGPRSYGKAKTFGAFEKENSSSMLMCLLVGFAYQGKDNVQMDSARIINQLIKFF